MQEARLARALKRDRERQKRILASGIEYEYQPLQAALPQKPKRIRNCRRRLDVEGPVASVVLTVAAMPEPLYIQLERSVCGPYRCEAVMHTWSELYLAGTCQRQGRTWGRDLRDGIWNYPFMCAALEHMQVCFTEGHMSRRCLIMLHCLLHTPLIWIWPHVSTWLYIQTQIVLEYSAQSHSTWVRSHAKTCTYRANLAMRCTQHMHITQHR